ncbi:kinesin-like protein KIN-12A [Morus notabilis]|uniref:kinesin-like protein KIN-12A n=1 Tax=Morus notabilis TaxID=981085 RepID=UPI000CED6779|nr:kinesin-like protein KIN-12A [Morus notabilis]
MLIDNSSISVCLAIPFFEIYNEQIIDLLDPNQKIIQKREDAKSGIFVENLTEECLRTMSDVKQPLMKDCKSEDKCN